MARLYGYLRRRGRRYAFGLFCLVVTATFAMAIPWLLKHAVDVIEHDPELERLGFYIAGIVALALLQMVSRTYSRFVIFNIGRDVEYEIRNDLFRHLETLDAGWYQRQQTGDLMSRLVNDIGAIRMTIGPGVLNLVNTPIYYLYAVSIMLTIDVRLTLLSLVAYPVVFGVMKVFSHQLLERTVQVQEGLAALSSRAQENISGIAVVKAYALEDEEVLRFRKQNDEFRELSLGLARVRGLIVPIMKLCSNAGILVVLWYGGLQVMAGRITIGDLVAFIAYLHLLAWPTLALGWMISILQRGRAAMMRLEQVFSAEPEIVGPASPVPLPAGPGTLSFERVRFARGRDGAETVVLDGVVLEVPAGKTIGLVGRTGAGKTTLAQLVPRLLDVSSGVVRLDGADVKTLALADLRRALGVVPQDPFLFSTTIRENVGFGLEASPGDPAVAREPIAGAWQAEGSSQYHNGSSSDLSPHEAWHPAHELGPGHSNGHPKGSGDRDGRIRQAVHVAALESDLESFPLGLDTPVGERGITLSGGQRQRVTLARALAIDSRVLLLDDALSSVDAETERKILTRLRSEYPERTCLLVTHRPSTLRSVDHVIVLDGGRIVEQGTHDDLIRKGGAYAEIFQESALEDELETL